jgi:hypothetical protein
VKCNAVVIEKDAEAAQALYEEIQACSDLECAVAEDEDEIDLLLMMHPGIKHFFVGYDLSRPYEGGPGSVLLENLKSRFPAFIVHSIPFVRKESVIVSKSKIFLTNINEIPNLLGTVDESEKKSKRSNKTSNTVQAETSH